MAQLASQISAEATEFKANAEAMEKTVADFKDKLATIRLGGNEKSRSVEVCSVVVAD